MPGRGFSKLMKTAKKSDGWIDVSVPLHTGMVHWPGDPEFRSSLAQSIASGGTSNVTEISTSVHVGTHMDAPVHFLEGGWGMEKMPIEATIGPCRVIEIQDKQSIKPEELEQHRLRPGERLLFKTRNSKRGWKTGEFIEDFVYISKEGARFIVQAGIQTVGVDYLSVGGFHHDSEETHQILLKARVWIIEGLNLSKAKAGRYDLICLPLKIVGSDGAPARAVLRPA
jgi:arylformamidase